MKSTAYIETPTKELKIKQEPKTVKKQATTKNETPTKVYTKTRGEHFKDIVIAMLITGIIAFVGGMYFANQHNNEVKAAANTAPSVAVAEPAKK